MDIKVLNKFKNLNLEEKSKTYKMRQFILFMVDINIVILSFLSSYSLTNGNISDDKIFLPILVYIVFNFISFTIFNCYKSLWSYAGEEEIISIVQGSIIYVLPIYLINQLIGFNLPIVFYVLNTLMIICTICGTRISYRAIRRIKLYMEIKKEEELSKVLIIGGGSAGSIIISELYENPQLKKLPIGIIDDDKHKVGSKVHGVNILGSREDIKKIVKEYQVSEIIFAIANIENIKKQEIIEICKETKCKLKTVPGIYEIIDGKVDIKNIRDVEIEDLLGRDTVNINTDNISKYLKGKTILVTGGGGSIGSELCRQIATFSPKKLVLLDIYENGAYEIQQELLRKDENLNLEVAIGSVRDTKRMEKVFEEYRPQVVFHAAAHKHVPLMESSPCEAIKNNIFGTGRVAMMADRYKAEKFVLISTDKAVNPTNIMGATKRTAEMIIQTINRKSETEFVAVRFGNVLGSNGSVIPLFKKQIEEGGPITVTHPEVTRYFMTIPEAVSLVMQAGAMANGGEIFVLNMGESVKIVDLAENLIKLSGLEPNVDIKIEFSGLRPGEKLYEELLMEEEGLKSTSHNKIFIGQQIDISEEKLKLNLQILANLLETEDAELVDPIMKNLVPTYIRNDEGGEQVAATL